VIACQEASFGEMELLSENIQVVVIAMDVQVNGEKPHETLHYPRKEQ